MTRQETIKILAVLKAAYPNFYKNMTKEEAQGTISIWATQFNSIPVNVVMIAVNKLVSTNTFPPSISEVKEKIRGLYWEAWQMKRDHNLALDKADEFNALGTELNPQALALVEDILAVCEPMRTRINLEPTLGDLLGGMGAYLTAPESDSLKRIK